MTDNEIIKALECCSKITFSCDGCPLKHLKYSECYELVIKSTLDLINRQKAEIERLNEEVDRLSQCVLYHDGQIADAVKEFAERLKEKAWHGTWETINHVDVDEIENLVKEMVGEG